jgi:hypothetical protein
VNALIPPPLLAKLEELRPTLEQQGVVQRRRGNFRLRFRHDVDGYVRHKSLEIGCAENAAAIQSLIEQWRQEKELRQHEVEKNRDSERACLAKKKAELELVYTMDAQRPGWRRRRQLKTWWEELQTDSQLALHFIFTRELPPRRKAGRPIKALW